MTSAVDVNINGLPETWLGVGKGQRGDCAFWGGLGLAVAVGRMGNDVAGELGSKGGSFC
jgi:hypothetical protein